jgi:hypothetical protein
MLELILALLLIGGGLAILLFAAHWFGKNDGL